MAQHRAQENQASLQKELDVKRASSSIKEEPKQSLIEEDEPMDTSCHASSSCIPNGAVNGYPDAASPGLNHANGSTASPELLEFVAKTFRKQFVLTLSELKRLFNLHLASMPAGQSVCHSISDHLLQDAILLCHCKQIMVPVSTRQDAAIAAASVLLLPSLSLCLCEPEHLGLMQ